jgi:hypothetical protein
MRVVIVALLALSALGPLILSSCAAIHACQQGLCR